MVVRRLPIALAVLLALPAAVPAADLSGTWVLDHSKLTYFVDHPLHHVEGVSWAARGKGTADAQGGRFLIALTVKSFESGDSNRDLHMLQATRAGKYPVITVRVSIKGDARSGLPNPLMIDATVSFAGGTTTYHDLTLEAEAGQGGMMHVTGTLPLTLDDFGIKAPSLLGMPIKNEIPVKMDLYWKKQ